jgi:F-type H+-transporting ATPase subunit delta
MRASSAAIDYANIFFEVCQDEKITDEIMYEFRKLLEINDRDIVKFLTIPIISKDDKKEALDCLVESGVNVVVVNLMKVLIDNNELNLFREILFEFQKIYQEKEKIKVVYVTSARPLDSDMLDTVREGLEKKLDSFVVIITNVIPKLIGGIKIEYDGMVVDNTILKQLNDMKRSFK